MGDWIINEFITNKLFQYSELIGKLVLCDKARIVDRTRLMLDKTIEILNSTSTLGVT